MNEAQFDLTIQCKHCSIDVAKIPASAQLQIQLDVQNIEMELSPAYFSKDKKVLDFIKIAIYIHIATESIDDHQNY